MTWLLAGLSMIGPFATDTYLPSFPALAQHFDVSQALVQQTLSVYLVGYAVMTLFYGTLSDSFGRRPVMLVAFAVVHRGLDRGDAGAQFRLAAGLSGLAGAVGRCRPGHQPGGCP